MDKEVESEILIELREIKELLKVICSNQEKQQKARNFKTALPEKPLKLSPKRKSVFRI